MMNMERLKVARLGGMDDAWQLPAEAAEYIVDMRQDSYGAWSTCGGSASIFTHNSSDPFVTSSIEDVDSIYWWTQHGGARQWLVWEHVPAAGSTLTLVYFNGSSGGFTTIASGRAYPKAPWQRTQYLATAGWLYVVNGLDEPIRWNGDYAQRVGFANPPPPPEVRSDRFMIDVVASDFDDEVEASTADLRGLGDSPSQAAPASAVNTTWRYGWAITYVNERGMESPLSPIAFYRGRSYYPGNGSAEFLALTTGADASYRASAAVAWDDAPDWVAGIRLYRTINLIDVTDPSDRSVLYFHSEYVGRMGRVVADGKQDRFLGPPVDTTQLGVVPQGFRYMALYKGTMFVFGMPSYPDRVHFSAPAFVEQFPALNYFDIGNRQSGEPTGLYTTKNALVVFREGGIYLIRGDSVNGFFSETLTEDIGSASPNAVVEVPGLGLLFVSRNGIHVLEGALENTGTPTRVLDIGVKIQRTWDRRVNKSALISAVAVHNHRDREIWVQVPADGGSRPSLGFVYHYVTNSWSIRTNYPMNCAVSTSDHRNHVFFGCWRGTGTDYGRGVHVYSPGYATKNGQSFTSEYRSSWVTLGAAWHRTEVRHLRTYGLQLGDRTATFDYRVDRHQTYEAATETRDQEDVENPRDKWGTAAWDTGTWTDYDPGLVVYPVVANGFEFQYRITGARLNLIGSDMSVAAGGGANAIDVLDQGVPTGRYR